MCEGLVMGNITAEGYPSARFHAGCAFADEVEELAIERCKAAFKAKYANVQPHSGSSANHAVMFSLLNPGETVLGLDLESGGHLTHGAKASVSGRYFRAVSYYTNDEGLIDYAQARILAHKFRPKLIVCGASAYPRLIDFKHFREIADEVGAYLLADISHIAGLVVAGLHPSPIDYAHFTTTSTYKQLYGPRGGLILMGNDYLTPAPANGKPLSELMQRAVFPFLQGTPNMGTITAKARALGMVLSPQFKEVAERIIADAKALAAQFIGKGYRVITGGSDNHMVLLDVLARGLTGVIAEKSLEENGIIVNKNKIPGDSKSAAVTSGIRLGTNTLALRGLGPSEMTTCTNLIDQILSSVKVLSDREYELNNSVKSKAAAKVRRMCRKYPIPRYPYFNLSSS
jgi:glycine hydroxymethyltransferase